ncbi:hypothetical protein CLF_101820 [Clonorchis sinensis]|uniref:Uncharacterized protein n=1 Tax=Clonorchis sinensis TaxID=79923 RepID=G7Y6M8_CLOSI|nr:hypothetical protein CLF_101820 [Clonorchis sinensis]
MPEHMKFQIGSDVARTQCFLVDLMMRTVTNAVHNKSELTVRHRKLNRYITKKSQIGVNRKHQASRRKHQGSYLLGH